MMEQARNRMNEARMRSAGNGGENAAPEAAAGGILSPLFKDKDKTIILALMLLLADENGDHSLLFALMYLLID